MGRRRRGRDVSGVLVLDKPRGMSSNDAVQHAKRLFNARKVGHTGALDPLATGDDDTDVGIDDSLLDATGLTQVLSDDLGVMDHAAISLARENHIPILVFSITEAGAFARVIRGEGSYTIVTGED